MALDIPTGLVVDLAEKLQMPIGFTAGSPTFVYDTPSHGEVLFTMPKGYPNHIMCVYPPNTPPGVKPSFKRYSNISDVLDFMGYNEEEKAFLFDEEEPVTNVVDAWEQPFTS